MVQMRRFQPTSILDVVISVYLLIHILISPTDAGCNIIKIGSFFCCDTTCPKGSQPVCSGSPPISSSGCEPCPSQSYAPTPTSAMRRCQLKKVCTSPGMIYKNHGSTETDAVCGCIDGFTYIGQVDICEQKFSSTSSPDIGGIAQSTIIVIVCAAAFVLIFIIVGVWCTCFRKRKTYKRAKGKHDRKKNCLI